MTMSNLKKNSPRHQKPTRTCPHCSPQAVTICWSFQKNKRPCYMPQAVEPVGIVDGASVIMDDAVSRTQ